jgi:hypothetical protein
LGDGHYIPNAEEVNEPIGHHLFGRQLRDRNVHGASNERQKQDKQNVSMRNAHPLIGVTQYAQFKKTNENEEQKSKGHDEWPGERKVVHP